MASSVNASDVSPIRNVVLVGSSGSGKTTLFEHLIKSRVNSYRGEKTDAERQAALAVASIKAGPVTITLLDAPGHPDFVGELRAGLRGADGAIFVVSASDGVDPVTEGLWRECDQVGMPRAIALTKLDDGRTNFDDALGRLQASWGQAVQPAYVPIVSGDAIKGNLSLVSQSVHDYSSGKRQRREADADELAMIEDYRNTLIEGIIQESENDDLMDRYLEGDTINADELVADLMKAVYKGHFFPVIPVNSLDDVGLEELLTVVKNSFPVPSRHKLSVAKVVSGAIQESEAEVGDPQGPLIAEVIRSTSDQFAGRLSLVRVYSGTLKTDDVITSSGHRGLFTGKADAAHPDHDDTEKVGPLSVPDGVETRPVTSVAAGQIAYVGKLAKAETSDTLAGKDKPTIIVPWALPEPLLPVAVVAASRNDEDKLPAALARLAVEDTSVRVERTVETDQTVLWTMGQAHVDLLLNRLVARYGVNVTQKPIKVAYRETFVVKSAAEYTHKKQSGGHGQYGKASIEIEPLDRGAGFEFVDKIVGGAIPRNYIPSVEKGVRSQLEKGVVAGFPVVDVRVTLLDGKHHPVDSSDMAFQLAGSMAVKDAAKPGRVTLLEPVDLVTIIVGEQYLGAVMQDISGRRGQMLGSDSDGDHRAIIRAIIPESELSRYAIDLRGLAQGSGSFTRVFHGYELVPGNLVDAVIAESKDKG
ncbi:MAG: elongation factor G-like protein EF-G2 [Propionibacteriaceae bacterium]|jgi:elongation factor G|nr:elongation factor G-like protein EF-G2 [Propionibacteriaceae bacterium]